VNRFVSCSLFAFALAAGSANAALVTVTGAHNAGPMGSTGPLAIGGSGAMDFNAGSGNNFVSGTVEFTNNTSQSTQSLTLRLTNFTFSSDAAGPVTLSVNLVQDFVISDAALLTARASHQFQGQTSFVSAAQSGRVSKVSTHESTALPNLDTGVKDINTANYPNFDASHGQFIQVGTDLVYRMNTTYSFVLNAAGAGVAQIIMANTAIDNANLVLVPLPPAAFAGIGGLAVVGIAGRIRRRKMNAQA
jgi:hypothetical protein